MKIYVFSEKISMVSPTRLAGEGRIQEIMGKLPKVLHPLLRQQVIPAGAINPFMKLRTRARKLLRRHASRDPFFGWVINPGKLDEIVQGMDEIRAEFYREKDRFLSELPTILESALEEIRTECEKEGFPHCDELVEAVRAAQPSKRYLESQIQFDFLKPRLIEIEPEEEKKVRDGIYWSALHEIAGRASEVKATKSPSSRLAAVDEIAEKLEGLEYVEPRAGRIAAALSECTRQLPRKAKDADWGTTDLLALDAIVLRLTDESALADGIENGGTLFPLTEKEAATNGPPAGDEAVTDAPVEPEPQEDREEDRGLVYNW